MNYENVIPAVFLQRQNRFVADCQVGENIVTAHVKNTGRCRELLVSGATVYLQRMEQGKRKTAYSVIGVQKGNRLVQIDSGAPNQVAEEALKDGKLILPELNGLTKIKREVVFGQSRFDFYLETPTQKAFLEVKGATFETGGVSMFPDAPTERGVKHIYELMKAKEQGYLAYLLFVIQMKGVRYFTPYEQMDAPFAKALREAYDRGVHILAYDCFVMPDSLHLGDEVEIRLCNQ